ncbi:uncharacterized protein IUM83_01970 [Phytophthora cinnamomi]|uniref:uncharacterized protein n=1 Tax=Phytophthora cinnamomi TaxID=4785 RepID=UPI003559D42B|nr:hypothetical protein IUM83_01970 [Phytophthora cinnamomi]
MSKEAEQDVDKSAHAEGAQDKRASAQNASVYTEGALDVGSCAHTECEQNEGEEDVGSCAHHTNTHAEGEKGESAHDVNASEQNEGASMYSEAKQVQGAHAECAQTVDESANDVGVMDESTNSSNYESISSGDSDNGVVEDDDQDPGHDQDELDDDAVSDSDAVQIDEAFIASLMIEASDRDKRAIKQRQAALREMQRTAVSSGYENDAIAYGGMDLEEAHPVAELREVCESPLLTLLYFMPKSLWVAITTETNRYAVQQVDRRAQALHAKQREGRCEMLQQIRRRIKSKKEYETHEILYVVGLLVARMLCPQKRQFSTHWSMVEDGAVPARNFEWYMARNRCTDFLRDLHFVNNEAPRTRDKLWKLRPVVDKLQKRFLAGWSLPSVFSFDEGVLPSTSRRNTTRMFMPDKPHRYGSKIFMTCDPRTHTAIARALRAVVSESSIYRIVKLVGPISVPCPEAVTNYQRWMGGVDVHDQVRLQKYSLQTSTKFIKYYKNLFFGFVDLALVNAYFSHKEAEAMAGKPALKRATPPPGRQKRVRAPVRFTHQLEQCEKWVTVSGMQKRRQRSCKVCALLRSDAKKSFATTFFCERCSLDDAKLWLCNRIRRQYKGVNKICSEIWHDDFDAVKSISPTLGKRVVLRRPGQRAGKRKKTSRELQLARAGSSSNKETDESDDV